METVGGFLTECAGRLAPFDRPRVGKIGCGAALAALAAAGLAMVAGLYQAAGVMAALRAMVLAGLAAVLLLFIAFAAAETLVERSVRDRIRAFSRESGNDLDALAAAAAIHRDRLAGGRRLAALLEELRRPV